MSIDIEKLEALARAATPGNRDAVKAPRKKVMTDGENRPWIVQSEDGQIIIVQGDRAAEDAKLSAAADPGVILTLIERLRESEQREQALAARYTALADEVRAMIQDSDGLAGYHLNGDAACWSEFDVGHLLSEPDEVGGKVIARLKAQWQAEALEWASGAFIVEQGDFAFERAEVSEWLSETADELRRQDEGGE